MRNTYIVVIRVIAHDSQEAIKLAKMRDNKTEVYTIEEWEELFEEE